MGKPYSDLEKQALAIIRGGGDPATSTDKGLANFWKWKLDPTDASHNLPASSTRTTGRKLDFVAIKPFATLPVATQYAKVTISQRSLAAATTELRTAAGLKLLADEPTALQLAKFKPARVYYRNGASTTSAPRTSRITKRSYKSAYTASDEGYSVPMGKTTGAATVLAAQAGIQTLLSSGTNPVSLITFSPEVYRG